jgi:hypothetical protein
MIFLNNLLNDIVFQSGVWWLIQHGIQRQYQVYAFVSLHDDNTHWHGLMSIMDGHRAAI